MTGGEGTSMGAVELMGLCPTDSDAGRTIIYFSTQFHGEQCDWRCQVQFRADRGGQAPGSWYEGLWDNGVIITIDQLANSTACPDLRAT